MERQPRARKKDRTGVFISIAVHVAAVAIVLFVLSRTELGQRWIERTIGATRQEKKAPPPKTEAPKTTAKAQPKAVDNASKSSTSRRAVATELGR